MPEDFAQRISKEQAIAVYTVNGFIPHFFSVVDTFTKAAAIFIDRILHVATESENIVTAYTTCGFRCGNIVTAYARTRASRTAASNNARKNFFISSPPDEADNADNENKDNSSAKSSYRRAGKERQ